jgi:hypothetical protein
MSDGRMWGILLAKLEKRIKVLENARSLGHQTITNTAIPVVNETGTVQQVIGKQDDDTFAVVSVAGPTPPTPAGLSITSAVQGGQATWDGTFEGGPYVAAPSDYARVEFHVSSEGPGFVPDLIGPGSTTMFGTTESPRGGSAIAFPLPYVTHWVKLVTRTQSGKFSAPSVVVAFNPQELSAADLDIDIETSDGDAPVIPADWEPLLEPLGVGALAASWPRLVNADTVTYKVFIGDEPVDGTDPATFVRTTISASTPIWSLPDGTPLASTVGYYLAVTAEDEDGPAIGVGTFGPVYVRQAGQDLVSSEYVYGGYVESRQIKTGTLDAALAIAQEIYTATSGRRISLSSGDGFRAVDQDGETVMAIPTDLGQAVEVNANLIARSITALGSVAMRSPVNEVAQNANLILRSGTTAPVTPPSLTISWNRVRTATDAAGSGFTWSGFCDGVDLFVATGAYGTGAIQRRDRITGAFLSNRFVTPDGYQPVSVVKIGSAWYTLGWWVGRSKPGYYGYSVRWFVTRWNVSPNEGQAATVVSEWEYAASADTYERAPAMGLAANGTDVLLARSVKEDGDTIWLGAVNPNTGASVGSAMETNITYGGNLSSVQVAAADFGANKYVITTRGKTGGDTIYVLNYATTGSLTRDTTREWPTAGQDQIAALIWDPTSAYFRQFALSDNIYTTYDGTYWTTGGLTANWQAGNTWIDPETATAGDGSDAHPGQAAGTHETAQGPTSGVAMKKRARLTITAPPIPTDPNPANHDDATAVGVYLGNGDGSYATQYRQAAPAAGIRSATIVQAVFSNADTLHPHPPQFGNFPMGTPGKVTSDDGTYYMDGEGNIKAKTLDLVTPNLTLAGPQRSTVANSTFPATETGIRWTTVVDADPTGTLTTPNNAVGGDGRVVFGRAGLYEIRVKFTFESNTTGANRTLAVLNSVASVIGYDNTGPIGAGGSSLSIVVKWHFAKDDWFRTSVNHNATSALDPYGASTGFVHLGITRIAS